MDSRETELDIQSQARLLGELLSCEVRSSSFHQPSPKLLKSPPETNPLVNAYGLLCCANTAYVSDSNRRKGLIEDIISYTGDGPNRVKTLQILIHPMWWYYEEKDCSAVWDKVI